MRSLISHKRAAAAMSCACGAGEVSRDLTKYLPLIVATSGAVAR